MRCRFFSACLFSTILALPLTAAHAQESKSEASAAEKTLTESQLAMNPQEANAAIRQSVDQAIAFLKNRGQADDGSFSSETGVAVTALCVRAILEHRPQAKQMPYIQKAIAYIEANVQSDGGIYAKGSQHRNYETCAAVGALVTAGEPEKYDSVLKRAEAFLREIQWDAGEGAESSDTAYGGAGYGSHKRPDLSNTSYYIDAMKDLGNGSEDEAIQKALRFVSRSQNLAGHGNDTVHADKINDGGFYYTPAAGGQSKANADDDTSVALRSYGSMTYAGLKSMIYAGLTKDDPRVVAAMDFIRKNYALDNNPGMGKAGLYYYYHTFGKALDAAEVDLLVDAKGNPHNWRLELGQTLVADQQDDGSWVNNGNQRWMEGDRQLVTAYALLALKYCYQE
ncbi:hypothetical protein [Stieleria varia]|uniref:Squalene cyclase C-terminal domain-containing protein n=1 Tax=Stieleria varia TaxID=2528005 RepID=A0A5C6AQE9_9BACT|nr:hypothetical protein [Stieleria varia]TWU01212.1 hypothetical protein Pla52n_45840 [Stieleria varia]